MTADPSVLPDLRRFKVLRATRLLGSPPEAAFDRLTRLAARLTSTQTAVISIVDESLGRTFFKSVHGATGVLVQGRGVPVSRSLGAHAAEHGTPLAVGEVALHPVLREDGVLRGLGVSAYLEVPLFVDAITIGALCVMDGAPRSWSPDDVAALGELAESVVSEIELRMAWREGHEQRSFSEALLDGVSAAVMAVDADQKVVTTNETLRRLFPSLEVGTILPPMRGIYSSKTTDGERVGKEEGPIARGLRGERTDNLTFSVVHPSTRKDIWIVANGRPVRDGDGNVIAAVATFEDVTEAKTRVALYETLARNIPGGAVVLFDHDLRALAVEGALLRSDGLEGQELVGKTLRELAAGTSDEAALDEVDVLCRRTLAGESGTIDLARGDATLMLHTSPVRDVRGNVSGGIVLALDVTADRRTQDAYRSARDDALRASRAKSQFLATMSHEIRTPLNGVLGMASVLEEGDLSPEQREIAATIRASGVALLSVIGDILDFSKLEAGKLEVESSPMDLIECIESAIDLVAPNTRGKDVELSYRLSGDVPRRVVSDLARVRQVLINLLGNAVKFTRQGEVVITVEAECQGEDVVLRLEVRDTGMGIAETQRAQLFSPFAQLDTSTTREFGGTGLGLTISLALATLLGGSIEVTSQLGVGSVFTFSFRARQVDDSILPPPSVLVPRSMAGRVVLLAYRNHAVGEILAEAMERQGATVTLVDSLPLLRAALAHGDVTSVALDVRVVGDEADALAEQLAARRIQAFYLQPYGERARSTKWTAALNKPIKPLALAAAIEGTVLRAPATIIPTQSTSLHVLVAEDNAVNQLVARKLLERMGHRVRVVPDGAEALRVVFEDRFDVLLLDLHMPRMDGYEVAKEIIRRTSRGGRPRIIALTASALAGDRERCLSVGMDGYVSKPIDVEELSTALGMPSAAARGERISSTRKGSVLDAAVIERLRELGRATSTPFFEELVDTFQADVEVRVNALVAANQAGDAKRVGAEAHRMKGSAGALGAVIFHAMLDRIESSADAGRLEDAAPLVAGLRDECTRTLRALTRLRTDAS